MDGIRDGMLVDLFQNLIDARVRVFYFLSSNIESQWERPFRNDTGAVCDWLALADDVGLNKC